MDSLRGIGFGIVGLGLLAHVIGAIGCTVVSLGITHQYKFMIERVERYPAAMAIASCVFSAVSSLGYATIFSKWFGGDYKSALSLVWIAWGIWTLVACILCSIETTAHQTRTCRSRSLQAVTSLENTFASNTTDGDLLFAQFRLLVDPEGGFSNAVETFLYNECRSVYAPFLAFFLLMTIAWALTCAIQGGGRRRRRRY